MNTQKTFKIDYDEVLISRRYFRSGESEYYINKSSCRLKDIHELLMDTGMGRDGYSVVGQGKIDQMVSSKPEDRRVIFEEAAGISKYRYRKAESEKKLEQTSDNLVRILDLISEVESRIEPLKRDSEKAKQYLKIKEELKEIEIGLFLNLIDALKETQIKLNNTLNINVSDNNKENEKILELDRQRELTSEKIKKCELLTEEYLRESYEIKNRISTFQNDISLLTNSKAHNNENVDRIKSEIEDLKNEIIKLKSEIEKNNHIKNNLSEKLSVLNESLINKKTEYSKLDAGIESGNSEYEQLTHEQLSLYQKRSDISSQIITLTTENESYAKQKENGIEDLELLAEDYKIYTEHINSDKAKLEEVNILVDELSKKLSLKEGEKYNLSSKIEELKNSVTDISILIENLESRRKLLSDMEKDMEGYAHSVKSVIKENQNGSLKHLKIFGTLSKLIKIEPKYTLAIEAALGNNLQNIVTQNEQDAKSAIEFLKKQKGGRATFLPIDAVKGKKLDDSEFINQPGYIAIASDIIKCEDKFDGVIRDALGRTIIIDNIDNAIKFAKKFNYKYKLATLTGEIFNAGGSITGGNMNKNFSFLSRDVEIAKLSADIESNSTNKKQMLVLIKNESEKLEMLNKEYDVINSDILLKNNEIIRFEYNIRHYSELADSTKQELNNIEAEFSLNDKKIEENSDKISKLRLVLQDIENSIIEVQKKSDNLQLLNLENGKLIKELNTEIIKMTVEISDYDNERIVVEQKIAADSAVIEVNNAKISDKENEINRSTGQDEAILIKIQEITDKIQSETEIFEEYELKIQSCKEEKVKYEASLIKFNDDYKYSNEVILTLAQEKVRIENKIAKCENDFQSITDKLWEEYELTYVTAESYRQVIENPAEVQKQVTSLRNTLKSLGNINVGAIEEYKTTKERYEFLSEQKNDLEKAKDTLDSVISDMESMMSKQFSEQIKIINDAFSRIFKEMFNGGDAELVITDSEDILSCGIEIHAQPPGKKLQNMTLFSGGEKAIIAISLMFALLEVRPSPLCILDEVEAALDDVSVYRFANYLRKISDKSQFAVITHRRGTMEEADMLYGVTMQEKGVSKLLQLNINEVENKILNK